MPRKRPKTAADRPTYRPPSMPTIAVPEQLQPFLAGIAIRHIIDRYGMDNVQVVLGAMIAEQARRELIDRRTSETLDGWKTNMRPMAAATTAGPGPLPTSDERRRTQRYRRYRQESVDSVIQRQARDRELEAGLAAILEREETIPGYRQQVTEIVDRVEAGQSAARIAQELGVSPSTVERRLAEVRKGALVSVEAEQLSNPCPSSGPNDGLGTNIPLDL
jgi:hypothetical protein